ncbi:MAG: hypothetical protein PHR35_04085 [Kiritimatiellae bacterium]|nr:hypothetical protein [Kiritimatiellia bacterium]
MISRREKALLHIYAQAAGLDKPTYRNILREHAGVSSSADPAMSQGDFRRAMASLEIHLWSAVDAGASIHLPAVVSRRGYWQTRVPVSRAGVGPSKVQLIHRLQDELTLLLPGTGAERDAYIQASMERAIGTPISQAAALSDRHADAVIECLRRIASRHRQEVGQS